MKNMPTIAVTDGPRPPQPPALRSPRQWLLIGCGLAAICLVAAGAAGAAGWVFFRPKPAATEPTVEYILDASPRMGLPIEGGTRLTQARAVLSEVVRPAARTVTAGLRVFGNGALPEPCRDTKLLVPLAPATQTKIADSLVTVQAGAAADAAMAESIVAAIRDLTATAGPHSLVVVSGGADSCNAEAGQLLAQEAKKAGIKFELFVIGYQVTADDAEAIKSMVDETPGATYLEAVDATSLRIILESIQRHVDNPSAVSAENVIATARAALPTAPAAAPATLEEASQIVLDQVVHPDTLDHEAIVFHWPDPIGPADTLEPAPDPSLPAPPTPITPPSDSWFFWVDDFPAGKFAHPSRFVLVDRHTRAVSVLDTSWWPVLNGAGLWVKPADYWNPTNWAFTNFKGRPLDLGGRSPAGPSLARSIVAQPARQAGGKAVALVANGWQPDQPGAADLALDGAAMLAAFTHAGLETTYLSSGADGQPTGPYSPAAVADWFGAQAGQLGAGDVLVFYVTGHATGGGDGPNILAGLGVDQLAELLRPLDPAAHIIVILDGSYSGGFINKLSPYADRIITATDAQLPALFDEDPANDPNAQADRGSEFTSGFAAGWEAILSDPAQRDAAAQKAQAEGRPLADVLAEAAFHAAVAVDAGAINGLTRPQMIPERQPDATATPIPSPTDTPTPTSTPSPTPTRTRTPRPPTATFTSLPPTATFTASPVPQPSLNFNADSTTLTLGQCTTLRWDSANIQDLHLDNEGVVGSGTRDVCPTGTTTYTMVANSIAGQIVRQVTITVNRPPPITISGVGHSDRIFYDVAGCGPTEVTIKATVQSATAVTLYYRVPVPGIAGTPWSQLQFANQGGDAWAVVLHSTDMSAFGTVEYFVAAVSQIDKAQTQVFTGPVYASCKIGFSPYSSRRQSRP